MGCGSSKESASNGYPVMAQKPGGGSGSAQVPTGHASAIASPVRGQIPMPHYGASPAMRNQDRGTASSAQHSDICNAVHNANIVQQRTGEGSSARAWPKILQGQDLKFTVYVYSHEITYPPRNMPCWTYVSQGFSQNNQPEVVFAVLRRPGEQEENFPEAPVEWMKLVYAMAGSGLNLELGQLCDLVFDNNCTFIRLNNFIFPQKGDKWMSMRRFGGIVHGISVACALSGVPIPPDSHHVIALTHEEADVARQFGVTRVIGHVGLAVRWFPHPPFIDRDREDCVVMADQAGSFRTKLPIARIYGLGATVFDDDIVLRIPEGETKRDMFRKHVRETPLSAALAFECFMSKDANGGYVWKAGQTDPMVYCGPNSGGTLRINIGYIAFAQHQNEDSWSMVEDGYGTTDLDAVILCLATWKAVKAAMENTQDIVVNLQKGTSRMRFRLEWDKTVYHNPIDGTEVKQRWKTYHPSGPPRSDVPSWPHIKMSASVLLVEPPPGHCDAKELVAYMHRILHILADAIPITPVPLQGIPDLGRQVIVEFEVPKCEGWLKMAMYPSMEGLSLEQTLPKIAQLVQPPTRSRIKLQLIVNVWGYEGRSAQFS